MMYSGGRKDSRTPYPVKSDTIGRGNAARQPIGAANVEADDIAQDWGK